MIGLIRDHNTLNGLRFSVIEFLVMAVAVIGFAGYLASEGLVALPIALLGVGANCITVALVGIGSLRAGEVDRSLAATFGPASRSRILAEHPRAQRATWILAAMTVIPGIVAAAVVAERLGRRA